MSTIISRKFHNQKKIFKKTQNGKTVFKVQNDPNHEFKRRLTKVGEALAVRERDAIGEPIEEKDDHFHDEQDNI